jgi:hypothetical protein
MGEITRSPVLNGKGHRRYLGCFNLCDRTVTEFGKDISCDPVLYLLRVAGILPCSPLLEPLTLYPGE